MKAEAMKELNAAFEREPRINLHKHPIRLISKNGSLILEGELETVAAKKIALMLAREAPGVQKVVDHLKVIPPRAMEDGEIQSHVQDALLQEPELRKCSICTKEPKGRVTIRESMEKNCGEIEIKIFDGTVILAGEVISLTHRRLAEVLAWWVPGTRNVLNRLRVIPPESDTDDEVSDAVRTVLEKDRFINEDQIRISTKDHVVTLTGFVPNETEKSMAENDSWYVPGVEKVINRIRTAS